MKKNNDPLFYYELGLSLQRAGSLEDAIRKYKKAVSLNPGLAAAHNNLGVIYKSQGKIEIAIQMYKRAILAKKDYAMPHYNLANILKDNGNPEEAVKHYLEAIAIQPGLMESYINLGKALKILGRMNEAVATYEKALSLEPNNPQRLAELVEVIHHACAWEKLGSYEEALMEMIRQGREGISPFIILNTPAKAEDQLACSRLFNQNKELPQHMLFQHAPKKSQGRLKVGYLSSDFHEHATAYLMAELFERHDRSRFNTVAYSYGIDDKSPMRARLVKAFDEFVDLRELSDSEAAKRIHDDGVDILIDLKGGLTGSARIGIPALRPAPIQVNYLGYPGTMGVTFIDYIIADSFIIPHDQHQHYSEKVVYLPDCYQPNDTHRKIANDIPTRAACGLPEQGFVFCCFNANYKITSQLFDIWMRLLHKVPQSVLWLFEANPSAKENLKREAKLRDIDPERIVFAPKAPLPEHLARHKLADLFLDTLPINAHTTTSDALWAGLPVLTCAGTTFAGRVAGSLLKAADLSELITYSLEDYEALALRLAQNPAQLLEIREKLIKTRLQTPLFDIEKFVRNIEKSYKEMWDIWQSGELPRSFAVNS